MLFVHNIQTVKDEKNSVKYEKHSVKDEKYIGKG